MSQATKRKHVVKEVLGDFVTPTENQQIVKVKAVLCRLHVIQHMDTNLPPTVQQAARHCPDFFLLYLCTCRSSPVGVTTFMKLSLPKERHSWWACPPSSARTSGSREASNGELLDFLLMDDSDICVVLFVPTEGQDRIWETMSFISATIWEKWISAADYVTLETSGLNRNIVVYDCAYWISVSDVNTYMIFIYVC